MSQTKVEAPFVENNANFRNLIINGDMKIAQRATSATGVGASTGLFTLDRHAIQTGNSAGRATMSQSAITDLPGFTQSLKLDCTTADTSIASNEYFLLTHNIEGNNVQQLKKGTSDAEKITVSFYVKGNASATYAVELYDLDNDRHASKTFAVTTSWNRISLTYDGDTTGAFTYDNSAALQFNIWLHGGSTFTGGTLQSSFGAANAGGRAVGISSFFDSTDREFFITGLQIEVGDQATDFEHLPIDVQLQRCFRYCFQVNPAQYDPTTVGSCNSSDSCISHYFFPVEMRGDPSLTTSGTASDYVIYEAGDVHACSAIPQANTINNFAMRLIFTSSGNLAQGNAAENLPYNADAILRFDAEY